MRRGEKRKTGRVNKERKRRGGESSGHEPVSKTSIQSEDLIPRKHGLLEYRGTFRENIPYSGSPISRSDRYTR